MNQGKWIIIIGILLLIGSCGKTNTPNSVRTDVPKSDYQDMRDRGHSEEDAVIFSVLKQQGYSDYDAINATKAKK